MKDLPILFAIAGFTVVGIAAIAKPTVVTAQFGIVELTLEGRNEVRAVHGGYGISFGLARVAALRQPELRHGILFAVAAALGGMAAGRLVSAAIDRAIGRVPMGYVGLEVVAAMMLMAVA